MAKHTFVPNPSTTAAGTWLVRPPSRRKSPMRKLILSLVFFGLIPDVLFRFGFRQGWPLERVLATGYGVCLWRRASIGTSNGG